MRNFDAKKVLAYGIIILFILPIFVLAFFVQLRLLMAVPVFIYTMLFYSGVTVKGNKQEVEFEIEIVD